MIKPAITIDDAAEFLRGEYPTGTAGRTALNALLDHLLVFRSERDEAIAEKAAVLSRAMPELPPGYRTGTTRGADGSMVWIIGTEDCWMDDDIYGETQLTRDAAVDLAWAHWQEYGDHEWVEFIDSLEPDGEPESLDPPTREDIHRAMMIGGCTSFPVGRVLRTLIEATEILMDDYNYDGHGWEGKVYAMRAGKAYLEGREPAEADINQFEEKFYILESSATRDNCALWWRPDSKGYTCDLEAAGLYQMDFTLLRCEDILVREDVARRHAVTHVRLDRLRADSDFKVKP